MNSEQEKKVNVIFPGRKNAGSLDYASFMEKPDLRKGT